MPPARAMAMAIRDSVDPAAAPLSQLTIREETP